MAPPSVRMVEVGAEHAGQRLDNYLMRLCKGVPKTHIYKAIRGGEVRVNKGRISADYRVVEGDMVRIPPLRLPDPGTPKPVPAAEFPIVFEDDAMLVVDKPAGVAVHGGSGVSFGVIEQLRAARPEAKFLELVHRLDRETSGLLMVAKKRSALLALHAMLREGRSDKHYFALVEGDWVNDRQHIKLGLSKWTTQSGERRVKVDPDGQTAHTIITLKQRFGRYSLVDAELRTGRTHQIRVHMASLGHPLLADTIYGGKNIAGATRQMLHARALHFDDPGGRGDVQFAAPVPADMTLVQEAITWNA